MNLAEKIYELRKSRHWSQEELAQALDISRQSVSKWESNQSIPDSEKIIQLSQLFDVSTDYLLKDDLLESSSVQKGSTPAKRVTLEMAKNFMDLRQKMAKWYALAAAFLITSPIALILLSQAQESGKLDITENTASLIGIIFVLTFVAIGVGILIFAGMQLSEYEFMETDPIALDPGIVPLVQEKQRQSRNAFIGKLILAIVLLILSPLSILIAELLFANEFISIVGIAILLILIAMGVALLIQISIPRNTYAILLEEGEYQPSKKKVKSKIEPWITIYWMTALFIYIVYSLYFDTWTTSWIIWPAAGILYVIFYVIISNTQQS